MPRESRLECSGICGSGRSFIISQIYRQTEKPLVVIVSDTKTADRLINDLRFFLRHDETPVLYFPAYNILPFKFVACHAETASRRIQTLYRLTECSIPPIVVTTVPAVVRRIIPRDSLIDFAELVMVDEEITLESLMEKLVAGGYTRSMIVEEPGDFCVRGGLVDIFSPLYPDPVRIEFFGDMVESIRFFSPRTQRTLKNIDEAIVLPAREAILPRECRDEVFARIRARASWQELPVTTTRELLDRLRNDGLFPGMESLLPLIFENTGTLFDYLPDNTVYLMDEPSELKLHAMDELSKAEAAYADACENKRLCADMADMFMTWETIESCIENRTAVDFQMVPSVSGGSVEEAHRSYSLQMNENIGLREELRTSRDVESPFAPFAEWLETQHKNSRTVVIAVRGTEDISRLDTLLKPYQINIHEADMFPEIRPEVPMVYVCTGNVSGGFVYDEGFLALITWKEIFGKRRRTSRKRSPKVHRELLNFGDLKTDDLIVHDEHGIGRYQGLVKLKVEGATNDFLLIHYKNDDRLYLPVDRMSMIQKYMGVDGMLPVLDRMGGKSWSRVREKVKRSAEKMAGELLKLYASRKVADGYAFEWQTDELTGFEGGFPYEETEDQRNAIEHVLNDMASAEPMDRLICGDVGYGKTEVALRGAFVAVFSGKQVAVLVPTTVLAEQHYKTFSSRFAPYPIRVECLSRFRSPKEQKEIIKAMKAGMVDIVIGTHRLLSGDVKFKDLGLIVLDEEQRFGVRHKEKLKKLRESVDVLALTATPIPRTLHMSLTGIRDISLISTPPEERRPIITYVSVFDDSLVAEAIRRELERKGQLFFLHNNVRSIRRMADHIRTLVPEVRLGIAHGQMQEDELEKVMYDFVNQDIDLLVCTTIIEAGLDIPSSNTIIVNRADRFGLSQIYQLRGRVGRGDEQAYAYLFIPDDSLLTRNAQKRLKVLMEHSDLGSGFQIAMSDLKIRGGGTILGASQSGHIAAVGYDMFLQLMEESIAELKGEQVVKPLDPEINISVSAFIPESYVPDIDQRLAFYRRLARMETLKDISGFKAESVDRFGPMPEEATNLLLKIMLRVLCRKAGVQRLDMAEENLVLAFSEAHLVNPDGIIEMVSSGNGNMHLTPDNQLRAKLTKGSVKSMLVQSKNILNEIIQRVNS